MIYLDTSCLLKLLWEEAESTTVRSAVATEQMVVVSSLAELEAEIQLKAAAAGGKIRLSQWRQYQAKLAAMEELKLTRLMTLDAPPAKAAIALGFEVIFLGHH